MAAKKKTERTGIEYLLDQLAERKHTTREALLAFVGVHKAEQLTYHLVRALCKHHGLTEAAWTAALPLERLAHEEAREPDDGCDHNLWRGVDHTGWDQCLGCAASLPPPDLQREVTDRVDWEHLERMLERIREGAQPWVAAVSLGITLDVWGLWMDVPAVERLVAQASAQAIYIAERRAALENPEGWLTKGPRKAVGWADRKQVESAGLVTHKVDLTRLSDADLAQLEGLQRKALPERTE